MKKNSGFTLVELLAVIVILAVLLAVAVPSIGNIIQSSKKNAFKDTASAIVKATNFFYSNPMGNQSKKEYTFSFDDNKKGETADGDKLDVSGQLPTSGKIVLTADGKTDLNVCNDTYCACKGEGTPTIFIVDKSVEICGTNEDGSTADNPITSAQITELSSQLQDLKSKFDASQDELSTVKQSSQDNKTAIDTINNGFLNKTYPVGSIYISISNTNPGGLFGGTWSSWGTGRVPVGVDTSQSEFNTVEKTGGEKTHTLNIDEMPNHSHGFSGVNDSTTVNGLAGSYPIRMYQDKAINWSSGSGIGSTGGGQAHNNLQPYITVYMWKRVS